MTAELVGFLSNRERGSDEALQDEADDIPF